MKSVETPRAPVSSDTWMLHDLLEQAPGFKALSGTLIELASGGAPVVALTGDLSYSNGLVRFQERYPERFVNCGISEQNMVSLAAGMATCGYLPFAATFASFLALLCCEQIRTDVAYTNLPVRLIGHHAGISLGFYGTSHHATEDLAIMRSIANLTVVAPSDRHVLAASLRASVDWPGPIYFRLGRGREVDVYPGEPADFSLGIANELRPGGSEAVVIATGSMVEPSLAAVDALRTEGRDVGLLDMHTIKPLDGDAVLRAAGRTTTLVTVEEHNVLGGLGGAVAEVVAEAGLPVRVRRHGIADCYSLIGPPTHLYRHYRLDSEGIADVVREQLEGPHG
jgi:transketolase